MSSPSRICKVREAECYKTIVGMKCSSKRLGNAAADDMAVSYNRQRQRVAFSKHFDCNRHYGIQDNPEFLSVKYVNKRCSPNRTHSGNRPSCDHKTITITVKKKTKEEKTSRQETKSITPSLITINDYLKVLAKKCSTPDVVQTFVHRSQKKRRCSDTCLNSSTPFKTKTIVNTVSLDPKKIPPDCKDLLKHPLMQAQLSIYRCQLKKENDNGCRTCTSAAIFEVVKCLYDCYKKKKCDPCKCVVCGYLPRNIRKIINEVGKSSASIGVETPSTNRKTRSTMTSEEDELLSMLQNEPKPVRPKITPSEKVRIAKAFGIMTPDASGAIKLDKEAHQNDCNVEYVTKIEAPYEDNATVEKALYRTNLPNEGPSLRVPSKKLRKARASGLLTSLDGKTQEQREKMLRNLAMNNIPLPEGKSESEKTVIAKVRKDVGLPPGPRTALEKEKYAKAQAAGVITPLKGKSQPQKENIIRSLLENGIPLPEGRTPAEKALIEKIELNCLSKAMFRTDTEKTIRSKARSCIQTLFNKFATETGYMVLVESSCIKDRFHNLQVKGLLTPIEGIAPKEEKNKLHSIRPKETESLEKALFKEVEIGVRLVPESQGKTLIGKPLRRTEKEGAQLFNGQLSSKKSINKQTDTKMILEEKMIEPNKKLLPCIAIAGSPFLKSKTSSEYLLERMFKDKARVSKIISERSKSESEQMKVVKRLADARLSLTGEYVPFRTENINKVRDTHRMLEKQTCQTSDVGTAVPQKISKGTITNLEAQIKENLDNTLVSSGLCERSVARNMKKLSYRNSYLKIKLSLSDVSNTATLVETRSVFTDTKDIKETCETATSLPSVNNSTTADESETLDKIPTKEFKTKNDNMNFANDELESSGSNSTTGDIDSKSTFYFNFENDDTEDASQSQDTCEREFDGNNADLVYIYKPTLEVDGTGKLTTSSRIILTDSYVVTPTSSGSLYLIETGSTTSFDSGMTDFSYATRDTSETETGTDVYYIQKSETECSKDTSSEPRIFWFYRNKVIHNLPRKNAKIYLVSEVRMHQQCNESAQRNKKTHHDEHWSGGHNSRKIPTFIQTAPRQSLKRCSSIFIVMSPSNHDELSPEKMGSLIYIGKLDSVSKLKNIKFVPHENTQRVDPIKMCRRHTRKEEKAIKYTVDPRTALKCSGVRPEPPGRASHALPLTNASKKYSCNKGTSNQGNRMGCPAEQIYKQQICHKPLEKQKMTAGRATWNKELQLKLSACSSTCGLGSKGPERLGHSGKQQTGAGNSGMNPNKTGPDRGGKGPACKAITRYLYCGQNTSYRERPNKWFPEHRLVTKNSRVCLISTANSSRYRVPSKVSFSDELRYVRREKPSETCKEKCLDPDPKTCRPKKPKECKNTDDDSSCCSYDEKAKRKREKQPQFTLKISPKVSSKYDLKSSRNSKGSKVRFDNPPCPCESKKGTRPCDHAKKEPRPCDSEKKESKPCDSEKIEPKPCDAEKIKSKPCDSGKNEAKQNETKKNESKPCDREKKEQKPSGCEKKEAKSCDSDKKKLKPCDSEKKEPKPCDREKKETKPCDREKKKELKPCEQLVRKISETFEKVKKKVSSEKTPCNKAAKERPCGEERKKDPEVCSHPSTEQSNLPRERSSQCRETVKRATSPLKVKVKSVGVDSSDTCRPTDEEQSTAVCPENDKITKPCGPDPTDDINQRHKLNGEKPTKDSAGTEMASECQPADQSQPKSPPECVKQQMVTDQFFPPNVTPAEKPADECEKLHRKIASTCPENLTQNSMTQPADEKAKSCQQTSDCLADSTGNVTEEATPECINKQMVTEQLCPPNSTPAELPTDECKKLHEETVSECQGNSTQDPIKQPATETKLIQQMSTECPATSNQGSVSQPCDDNKPSQQMSAECPTNSTQESITQPFDDNAKSSQPMGTECPRNSTQESIPQPCDDNVMSSQPMGTECPKNSVQESIPQPCDDNVKLSQQTTSECPVNSTPDSITEPELTQPSTSVCPPNTTNDLTNQPECDKQQPVPELPPECTPDCAQQPAKNNDKLSPCLVFKGRNKKQKRPPVLPRESKGSECIPQCQDITGQLQPPQDPCSAETPCAREQTKQPSDKKSGRLWWCMKKKQVRLRRHSPPTRPVEEQTIETQCERDVRDLAQMTDDIEQTTDSLRALARDLGQCHCGDTVKPCQCLQELVTRSITSSRVITEKASNCECSPPILLIKGQVAAKENKEDVESLKQVTDQQLECPCMNYLDKHIVKTYQCLAKMEQAQRMASSRASKKEVCECSPETLQHIANCTADVQNNTLGRTSGKNVKCECSRQSDIFENEEDVSCLGMTPGYGGKNVITCECVQTTAVGQMAAGQNGQDGTCQGMASDQGGMKNVTCESPQPTAAGKGGKDGSCPGMVAGHGGKKKITCECPQPSACPNAASDQGGKKKITCECPQPTTAGKGSIDGTCQGMVTSQGGKKNITCECPQPPAAGQGGKGGTCQGMASSQGGKTKITCECPQPSACPNAASDQGGKKNITCECPQPTAARQGGKGGTCQGMASSQGGKKNITCECPQPTACPNAASDQGSKKNVTCKCPRPTNMAQEQTKTVQCPKAQQPPLQNKKQNVKKTVICERRSKDMIKLSCPDDRKPICQKDQIAGGQKKRLSISLGKKSQKAAECSSSDEVKECKNDGSSRVKWSQKKYVISECPPPPPEDDCDAACASPKTKKRQKKNAKNQAKIKTGEKKVDTSCSHGSVPCPCKDDPTCGKKKNHTCECPCPPHVEEVDLNSSIKDSPPPPPCPPPEPCPPALPCAPTPPCSPKPPCPPKETGKKTRKTGSEECHQAQMTEGKTDKCSYTDHPIKDMCKTKNKSSGRGKWGKKKLECICRPDPPTTDTGCDPPCVKEQWRMRSKETRSKSGFSVSKKPAPRVDHTMCFEDALAYFEQHPEDDPMRKKKNKVICECPPLECCDSYGNDSLRFCYGGL